MKNRLKKALAFVLAVLILVPAMSFNGFALFDKITDVKVKSIQKFSYKQIKEYVEYIEEEGGFEVEEDYQYLLSCDLGVTISTGEVIATEDFYGISKDEKREVDVYSYVDVRECKKAYESGKLTVPVHIEITLLSSIGIKLDQKVIEKKVTFSEKIIKKMTLASGSVTAYEFYGMYLPFSIENLKFDIVYNDGTKKTAEVKSKEAESVMIESYTLDGEEIYCIVDDQKKGDNLYGTIYFYDYVLRVKVMEKAFPVKKVKINNVTFDEDFKAQKLTYTITTKDGKAYKKTYEFDLDNKEKYFMDMYTDSVKLEGVYMQIALYSYESEEYPPQKFAEVSLTFSNGIIASKTFEGPKEEATALGEFIFKIKQFITGIFERFFILY